MFKFRKYFLILSFLLSFFSFESYHAQSFPVVPKGWVSTSNGVHLKTKILFMPDSTVYLEWPGNINGAGFKIKIGSSSGNYNYTNSYFPKDVNGVAVGNGVYRDTFIPSQVNLPVGRYFGIITNSQFDNLNDIVNDQNALYSNEFQFVVEATSAPTAIAPLGTIDNSTPVFQWTSISGVVSYWLLVSSNPFEITTDSLGNIQIEGANLVWNYTTNQTSAQYGDVNPLNPYDQGTPPPLLPGHTYNYVILNLYEENNPIFGSPITSGVYSFTYESANQQVPPQLFTPADSSSFDADETITFTWESVDWANSYSIYLYQRVMSFGGNDQTIDVPVWNSTTTNTFVDFNAGSMLNKGTYVWFVVPNDAQGAGAASETFLFYYNKELGSFKLRAKSTLDNSTLLNYQAQAVAIDGGITPANPFLVIDSETYSDSLVVGTYQFTGSKVGYSDTTVTVTITADDTPENPKEITFYFTPLPALISGNVFEDGTNQPVANANVVLTNTTTGDVQSTVTSSNGYYYLSTVIGSYRLDISKPGYISSAPLYLNLPSGQTNVNDIYLVKDEAFISGKVVNDLGSSIQLASVTATKGNTVEQTNSNENGDYSFTLSSGSWTIEVSKLGFISPEPLTVNLATGDNLQNQNLTLIPRANQVSGIVYKIIDLGNGQTSSVPFGGVTVTASPLTGTSQTAVTDASGNYIFSLRQGTYTFSVSKSGYTPSNSIQLSLGVGETVDNIEFTLTPNPASVSGQVKLSDGTGLSGATVEVAGVASTQTDVNGLYTLSLSEGTHEITASKTGYISPDPVSLSISPGDNFTGIDFTLTPNAGTISGSVTSGGLPLSGATVTFISGGDTLTAATDNYGDYTKSLQPGTWSVFASKSGFITSDAVSVSIGPGQSRGNNNFSLVQNIATVSGLVTSNSSPLRNADVVIYDNATGDVVLSTVSNASGSFSSPLEAGKSYKITASKTGYSSDTKTTEVLAPQSSVSFTFELAPNPSSISGKIFSSAQTTLSQTKVYLKNSNNTIIDSVASDQNGNYSFGLSAGDFTVLSRKAGYIPDSVSVSVAVGQTLGNVNLTLAENFASISGYVKDSQNTGLEGVMVNLVSSDGGKTTFSLSDGSYLLSRLVGGTYTLTFSKEGFSDTTISPVTFNDGESKTISVNLALQNGELNGHTYTSDGNVLPDVTIQVDRGGKSYIYATSDEAGFYSLTSLAAGSYTVTASKAGYRSSQISNFIISSTDSVVTIDFNDFQKNTALVIGSVIDSSGSTPLAGAEVAISGDNGSASTQSGSSGEFVLSNLFPGNYQLTAQLQNYSAAPISITIGDTTTVVNQNIVMTKTTGTISGNVVNQLGASLGFPVAVKAASGEHLYTVQSDNNGNFIFQDVAPDSSYTVSTDIYAEGYVNAVQENVAVISNQNSNVGELVVAVHTSKIFGNVGVSEVSVQLNDDSGNTVAIQQSDFNGDFDFTYLAEGSYNVIPVKAGYVFSPASQSVTVGIGEEKNINFSSTPNIADLAVRTVDESGNALSQVVVTVVNSDTNFIQSENSNGEGLVLFNNLPADTYIVTPSLNGFSSTPVNNTLSLNAGDSTVISFTFVQNEASISGTIFKEINGGGTAPLPGAVIEAKRISSGETFRAQSDSSGNYLIADLPRETFDVTVRKSGFVSDERQADLSGGDAGNFNFTLAPKIVVVTGKVVSAAPDEVSGLQIDAVSNFGEFQTITDNNGDYTFNELPISVGENDTTLYVLSVSGKGISQIIRIPASALNTTVEANDFLLPSGEITVSVTECGSPLQDVQVTIVKPDGTTISKVTGENGVIESGRNLSSGEYSIHLLKSSYLAPQRLKTELLSDTSSVDFNAALPFTFVPVSEAFSNSATELKINFIRGCELSDSAYGKIYYKLSSVNEYSEVEMTKTDSSFTGEIPALYSTETIDYYVKARSNGTIYKSGEFSVTPKAAGILSSLNINPELNNILLRPGDNYQINLVLLDGIQQSLKDKFTGAGHEGRLLISVSSNLEISFPNEEDSASFVITADEAGESSISVTAFLNGVSINKTASFTVGEIVLESFTIASPQTRLSNRSAGIQFSLSATDTSGRSVALGNNVEWDIAPVTAISDNDYDAFRSSGFYRPVDSTFFGNIKITAKDAISGLSAETELSVYAEIYPNASSFLSNNNGFSLLLPTNAVNIPVQLELNNRSVRSVKKYVTPIGSSKRFVAADNSYSLSYSSTTALPGDSLMAYGKITLPDAASFDLMQGGKALGYYDTHKNNWRLLSGTSSLSKSGAGDGYSYDKFNKFGEYILLSESQPLGLKYLAALPSPFSPDVAPVKIGYFLTSDAPPAMVTIKIYNINGELVRTLLENDIQFPGKYGGSGSLKEITWDGKTDGGNLARNGRYIIHIFAKDGKNEVSQLLQVVLIK